jgi:predicted Zn finger-like uncharacterized protein
MTLEAQCPNCEVVFEVDDFDPEDPDQEVECPECGEEFACDYDGTTLTLVPFIDDDSAALIEEEEAADEAEE